MSTTPSRWAAAKPARPPSPGVRGPLTIRVVDDAAAAEQLREAWDELADACGAGPFARPAYGLAWWQHLGRGRLLVATAHEGGRLVALAPLHERRVGPCTVARWLGHGLGTIAELLVRPGHERAAGLLLQHLAAPTRVLDLVECREQLPGLAALQQLPGRTTTAAPRDRCPVADIDPGDPLAHLALREHKSMRTSLAARQRRIERAGLRLRMEVTETAEHLDALLPDLLAVFDAAEADRPRQHLLRPPWDGFVLDYLRETLDQGRSVVMLGYLDDRPFTLNAALLGPGTFSFWIGRYDPAAREFGPGNLMLRESFLWAGQRGIGHLDLLLGEGDYKRHWSTGSYATTEVHSATAWAGAAVLAAERATTWARERRQARRAAAERVRTDRSARTRAMRG